MITRHHAPAGLAAAGLLAFALALSGCTMSVGSKSESAGDQDDDKKDGDEKEKEEAVPVTVETLERGSIESVLRFSSNLQAEQQVRVHAQAARLVRTLLVEEGDRVKKDQLLLRLQDDEQQSALAKIRSQYERAQRERERLQRLFEKQLVTEQAFSDATYEYEQLGIALQDAKREMGYTEVKAPIHGTITVRLVNVGDQVTIGQHLFDLVDFDSLVAPVYVPEKELAHLKPGLEARITTQAFGERGHRGSINRISPVVDPRSGTVKVTVAIEERNGLRPGMYVDTDLVAATHRDVTLVPKRALVYDKDQIYVYRLKEERRVERVPVVPVLSDREYVEPVSGLNAGDQVVVAGQAGLKDAALVRLPGDPEPEPDENDDDEDEE